MSSLSDRMRRAQRAFERHESRMPVQLSLDDYLNKVALETSEEMRVMRERYNIQTITLGHTWATEDEAREEWRNRVEREEC